MTGPKWLITASFMTHWFARRRMSQVRRSFYGCKVRLEILWEKQGCGRGTGNDSSEMSVIQVVIEVKTGYPCLAIRLLVRLNSGVRRGRRSVKYAKHYTVAVASRRCCVQTSHLLCHRFCCSFFFTLKLQLPPPSEAEYKRTLSSLHLPHFP